MTKSHDKEHVTETPDVSYIKNVDVTHEVSDVYISGIAKFVVALSILMIASFLLMWGMFRASEARLQGAPGFGEGLEKTATTEKTESGAPAGAGLKQPKNPLWEIKAVREQWNEVLEHGPVDKDGKRYGMPIEKAKEEILKQGLPARPQTADGRKQTADGRKQ